MGNLASVPTQKVQKAQEVANSQESGGLHVFEFHGTGGHMKALLIFMICITTILLFAYLAYRWHRNTVRWRNNQSRPAREVQTTTQPRNHDRSDSTPNLSTTRRSNPSILERIMDRLDDRPSKKDNAILTRLNQMQALTEDRFEDMRRDNDFRMSMMEMGYRHAIANSSNPPATTTIDIPQLPPRRDRTPRFVELSEL